MITRAEYARQYTDRTNRCPCYGCPDRWVTEDARCHIECSKYRTWRAQLDDCIKDARKGHDADDILAASAARAKKRARYLK